MTALTIHAEPDGGVRVEQWEPTIEVTAALLGDGNRDIVTASVQIHAVNGTAEYEITGWNAAVQAFACRLVQVAG